MKRSKSALVIVPSITIVSPAVSANGGSVPCWAAHVNNFVRFSHVISIVTPAWTGPSPEVIDSLQQDFRVGVPEGIDRHTLLMVPVRLVRAILSSCVCSAIPASPLIRGLRFLLSNAHVDQPVDGFLLHPPVRPSN